MNATYAEQEFFAAPTRGKVRFHPLLVESMIECAAYFTDERQALVHRTH